jgi:hypothetical protein
MKAVESHEAVLALWKCDVIRGCSDAIMVISTHAIPNVKHIIINTTLN